MCFICICVFYFILRFLTIIYYVQTVFFSLSVKLAFFSHIENEKLRININSRINSVSKIVQVDRFFDYFEKRPYLLCSNDPIFLKMLSN